MAQRYEEFLEYANKREEKCRQIEKIADKQQKRNSTAGKQQKREKPPPTPTWGGGNIPE